MSLDYNPNPVLDPQIATFRWPETEIKPAPRPEPDYRWEGPMRGKTGSARNLNATLVLTINLRDGQVSGFGFSDRWPHDCADNDRSLTISGEYHGDAIRFRIVFPNSRTFRDNGFDFIGAFAADRTEIHGEWTYRCDGCTCRGSRGNLSMVRIEEKN